MTSLFMKMNDESKFDLQLFLISGKKLSLLKEKLFCALLVITNVLAFLYSNTIIELQDIRRNAYLKFRSLEMTEMHLDEI